MAELFSIIASALSVSELSVKLAKVCTEYVKDIKTAREDINRLEYELLHLGSLAAKAKQSLENQVSETGFRRQDAIARAIRYTLERSECLLDEMREKLEPFQALQGGTGTGTLTWPLKGEEMEAHLAELGRLTLGILLGMQVDQTMDHKMALDKLPVVREASYDSYDEEHNAVCIPGTRVKVLREISEWAENPQTKPVYWLNGMAGTGKSTISRTIARKFSVPRTHGIATLGASFFFKRGEGDRGTMSKLFSTIASQLAHQVPGIARYIKSALDKDPAIYGKALKQQFESLIVQAVPEVPPYASSGGIRTILVVIDALDECDRERDVELLITLLSTALRRKIHLKFFLTSRPELRIRLGFNRANGTYDKFVLHEVPRLEIKHDINLFLNDELRRVKQDFDENTSGDPLPSDWPTPEDFHNLVQMAIPLFIFAVTVCRFVADRRGGSPDKKLRRVLDFQASQSAKLHATYMPVLEQLTGGLPPDEQKQVLLRFHEVVGVIVLLEKPLPLPSLAGLLGITINEISEVLDFLHSVLYVPSTSLSEQPVRPLHLSFRDFLVDPRRRDEPFWIDEQETHEKLAIHCLRVLNTALENDICGLKAPGTEASEVSPATVKACLSPELQYACRFYAYHLQKSETATEKSTTARVWEFLSTHFLQWLEALTWMGRLREYGNAIRILQSLYPNGAHEKITKFLVDCKSFVENAHDVVQRAPLQIYSSALVSAPSANFVRETHQDNISNWITVVSRLPPPSERVYTFVDVTFSPDAKLVVSASGRTVHIWNTSTGRRQHTLEGHMQSVKSATFSPNSQLLASASANGTVIIWAVDSGERQHTLEGHTGSIESVKFSPDGQSLASASDDTTVIIWDTARGRHRRTLEHGHQVHSVIFSPDGLLLASVSNDTTLIVWHVATGQPHRVLDHGDWVNCAAFSPDGLLVASASDDKTVIIWDTTTGRRRHTLEHGKRVQLVTFSPDGQLVASSTDDRTVTIWDANAGRARQAIGVGAPIRSLAFHHDNRQILTNVGAFAIHGVSKDSLPETSEAKHVGYGIKNDRVTLDGQNILLFPGHYRPVSFAVNGFTIATSTVFGEVLIMRFDLHRAAV